MLKALNLGAEFEWSSRHDVTEPKTIFKLGVLDAYLRANLEDDSTEFAFRTDDKVPKADVKVNRRKRDLELVRFGLKGWVNFKDEQGNDFPFEGVVVSAHGKSRSAVSEKCLRSLPQQLIEEMAEAILKVNRWEDPEESD